MIRSPRFIRPHRILIRNKVAELDGVAKYQTTTVNHVCVDASYGMKQLQKGIQPTGDLLVIVDMNDLVAFEGAKKRIYKEPREFEKLENTESHFTLRPPTRHWLPHSLFHQYKPAVNAADFDDDSAGHNNTCSSIQRPAMYEPRVSA